MLHTIPAVVMEDGTIKLLEEIKISKQVNALVTILDDSYDVEGPLTTLLSQKSLAKDWDKPEEDEAWKHLQPEV